MPPRSSALPVLLSNEENAFNDWEEEITRASPEPEDEFPDDLRGAGPRRRRPNRVQGRSLEKLGHAVEYLVDSRMFAVEPSAAKAERDAVRILMRLSRMVFCECEQVITIWDRMSDLWERPAKSVVEGAGRAESVPQL
jgi:hypothetical protein